MLHWVTCSALTSANNSFATRIKKVARARNVSHATNPHLRSMLIIIVINMGFHSHCVHSNARAGDIQPQSHAPICLRRDNVPSGISTRSHEQSHATFGARALLRSICLLFACKHSLDAAHSPDTARCIFYCCRNEAYTPQPATQFHKKFSIPAPAARERRRLLAGAAKPARPKE